MLYRFVKYYLMLLLQIQAASSLFRLIGAVGRNMIIANTYGFFILLLVFAMSGFVLSRGKVCECQHYSLISYKHGTPLSFYSLFPIVVTAEDVKKWWIWGYYISPMMYASNAISVNEFRGHSWKHVSGNTELLLIS